MTRVKLLPVGAIPSEIRDTLNTRAKARGQTRISELFRLLAQLPPLASIYAQQNMKLYEALPIESKAREAMIIRIANYCDAPYVLSAHTDIGLKAGLNREQICALKNSNFEDSTLFSSDEIELIKFAAEVVSIPQNLSDVICNRLIERYGEAGFVALAMLCAQYASASIFTTAMRLKFEHDAAGLQ